MKRNILCTALLSFLAIAGCSSMAEPDPTPDPSAEQNDDEADLDAGPSLACAQDGDCGVGHICVNELCVDECEYFGAYGDDLCDIDCALPDPDCDGLECVTEEDCGGAPCINHECQPAGCTSNDDCGALDYCLFSPVGPGAGGSVSICGFSYPGTCTPRPTECDPGNTPVCGCDQITYPSACHAAQAGWSVMFEGPCGPQ